MPRVTTTVTTVMDCDAHCHNERPRVVFKLKVARDAPASPVKTPKFFRSPLRGEVSMATQLTATQQVDVVAAPKDRRGNPATVQDPTWSCDNTDVLALTPSADGLTCTIVATGMLTQPGTPVNVQFNADADMGAGVVPIIGTLQIDVVAGNATVVGLTAGTPTEQPT